MNDNHEIYAVIVWAVAGLALWLVASFAHGQEWVMQPNEAASTWCRSVAESVRMIAESRDAGEHMAGWLIASPSPVWINLVFDVWESTLSPTELYWQTYAECVRGTAWEVES